MMVQINKDKIKAISFDLDDTLYSNEIIIERAETSLMQWLAQHTTAKKLASLDWNELKNEQLRNKPLLKHDISEWRLQTIQAALLQLKYELNAAKKLAKEAMEHFVQERSKVDVSQETHIILKKLKGKFPLVVITNGNLDLKAAGLDAYFDYVYKANLIFPKKPHPHMFHSACNDLNIKPYELLHIGDNIQDDIQGAQIAGCQSAWIPKTKRPKPLDQSIWQLDQLDDLLCLIE